MKNEDKIILDLCGGTGAWSKPYKDAGYKVVLVTLPEKDIYFFDDYWQYIDNVYGILAAPKCTQFSLARTTAKTPRNLAGGYRLVRRCLEIVEDCRIHGNLRFWALENPLGYLRQIIGKPPLTFQPCDYAGHLKDPEKEGYTKKTDLWGYYKLPTKKPVELTDQQKRDCSINSRILPEIPENYVMPKDMNRTQVKRSITAQGFAKAFYKANK